jgi:hypothetical protein
MYEEELLDGLGFSGIPAEILITPRDTRLLGASASTELWLSKVHVSLPSFTYPTIHYRLGHYATASVSQPPMSSA